MTLTLTPEQNSILDFARTRKENLLISALAGTAKTTTIEHVATKLNKEPIIYLVFNKRNQEEAARRMPDHVRCLTANALGHGVWSKFIGRRLVVNTRKNYDILKSIIDDLGRAEAQAAYNSFTEILKAVQMAKRTGYIPTDRFQDIRPLCMDDPFEEQPTWLEKNLLDRVLTKSIQAAFDGLIDFDDQIYMPVLFGGAYPEFPLVVLDEAQDLSPINHAMLKKLITGRFIAVGDPNQSIYAFRGAVASGMSTLRKEYSMEELTLSVSFRCPRAVVRNSWWHVPTFNWPEWAEEGEVNELETWTPLDNSAIICRNNAPLLSCALNLIRSGRGVNLVGSDIGPGLIRTLKKLGPESMTQAAVIVAIDRLQEDLIRRARSPGMTADKCECLRVFAEAGPTLSAAVGYAEHIFKSAGKIQLLSGHKAKGLEWKEVFHLDGWRIPNKYARSDEEVRQELNVRYVIETRARHTLNKVNLTEMT